jgi:hypothetical protein
MDWLGLIEAMLPRGFRRPIVLAFVLGLLVFPPPFDSAILSLIRCEGQQVTSLLERSVGGALHAMNQHCGASPGVNCQR